jgi:hypothetical protein
MSTMKLVQCVVCGEVFEEYIPVCPGCRSRLGARPLAEQPVIQNSQQEAKRDSSVSVVLLTILGILVLVPFVLAIANSAGLPTGIGLLLAAIAVTVTIVGAANHVGSPPVEYRGEPNSSVVNPYQATSYAHGASQKSPAGQVAKTILYVLLLIVCGVICLIVGLVVFVFIICASMV